MARIGLTIGRRAFLYAVLATSILATIGFIAGYQAMRASVGDQAVAPSMKANFFSILSKNASAALGLYSGVVLVGLTTCLGLVLLGGYVGGTFAVAVATVGFWPAWTSIAWYAPLEFVGLLLSAVAGLYPVASAVARDRNKSRREAYMGSLRQSLIILAGALACLVIAALIESFIIHQRT